MLARPPPRVLPDAWTRAAPVGAVQLPLRGRSHSSRSPPARPAEAGGSHSHRAIARASRPCTPSWAAPRSRPSTCCAPCCSGRHGPRHFRTRARTPPNDGKRAVLTPCRTPRCVGSAGQRARKVASKCGPSLRSGTGLRRTPDWRVCALAGPRAPHAYRASSLRAMSDHGRAPVSQSAVRLQPHVVTQPRDRLCLCCAALLVGGVWAEHVRRQRDADKRGVAAVHRVAS